MFGTDIGLAEGPRSAFIVVPRSLVAARWMRGETGWIPGVLKHLISCRDANPPDVAHGLTFFGKRDCDLWCWSRGGGIPRTKRMSEVG